MRRDAQDREMQQPLLDLTTDFNLTQVHDQPARENCLLDLFFFTTNPSIIKSTTNALGISDHDMVIADFDTKPFYTKQRLKINICELSAEILRFYHIGLSVHKHWDKFKVDLKTAVDVNIPSKIKKKSKTSTPWITNTSRKHTYIILTPINPTFL